MLKFLNQCSRGRGAWLLLALTAFVLEMVALWFQHVMLLKPCVLCIYERCALFGVMGAGLVGAIAPKARCAMVPSPSGFTVPVKACNWPGSTP